MNELQLIKSERLGKIEADIYSNGEDMFMTINQLSACLGYADKSGVEKIIQRNEYLKKPEFSGTDNLSVEWNGQMAKRETRIFTEDGIYEITMLSGQPKAKEFRAWIRGILKALRSGKAKLVALPEDYSAALRALADEADKNKALAAENEAQKQVIANYEPKVQYVDKILSSRGTLTAKQIAADYDMTAQELNKILHEEHVQYKVNDQWILYKEHMGMGYTKSSPVPITRSDGRSDFKLHTQWTQKGRLFIHEILTKRGILAVIDRKLAGEQMAI